MKKNISFFLSFFLIVINLHGQVTLEKPTLNNDTDQAESDFPSEFSCEGLIIHPNDEDFGDDPTSIGKVIIWTNEDDEEYYTPYQIADRVVKIEVKFPPAQSASTIYFRVVDHDAVSYTHLTLPTKA